jgi:alpha-ketoglutarate-dependent taurine dioxygenase
MDYQDRAAHRSIVEGRVYTSADYPPNHELFFHNEATYAKRFPSKLFLHCLTAASTGGETPIADSTEVCARLAPEIVRTFAEKGVCYVRHFGTGAFGPSWQTAFQTEDRDELEAYCRRSGIETEWVDGRQLRTRQIRPAVIRHPVSGRPVWFNHAAALHVSTLPPATRRTILKLFSEADYPCNTYHGDGSTIEPEVLDAIRDAYRSEAATFAWRAGDLLILDNLRVAHGRAPYKGRREVLAVLAEPTDWTEVEVMGVDQLGSR